MALKEIVFRKARPDRRFLAQLTRLAEFYTWAALRKLTMPGNCPLSGKALEEYGGPFTPEMWRRLSTAASKALAKEVLTIRREHIARYSR